MSENINVLMVDDEEQFRATTSRLLTRRGYHTTIAGTGEEAIEILKQKPHDVVVLDIKMPGMDGHEALSEIKRINPDTKVIMLTGHGTPDSARESLIREAFDYLNKPCDIDVLCLKINEAYAAKHHGEPREEKAVRDIMIRIEDYTTVTVDETIRDTIMKLMESFKHLVSSSRIMETGHRSLLVFDKKDNLAGILSIPDLIRAIRPAYLSAPKPSTADSMEYSFMFWKGLFTTQTKMLAHKKVKDIMSDPPLSVDEDANLMEVADLMFREKRRRVVVRSGDRVVGIVREQEIFFEMANIIIRKG
ncbi:MAG: response regulator [Desulfatiglans sp.]|jgi:CheY-like chemotaxis protein|nr:response regulator [Thermodesulfobacteriota bacterium]MEE4353982.1 response regulator [Desulfatiglans sp.]